MHAELNVAAGPSMCFQEILRIWSDSRHHRCTSNPEHVQHSYIFFVFPPSITQSRFVRRLNRLMDTASVSFATTPSANAARLHTYVSPPSHPWPPHSPSPALARHLHAFAAVQIFTAIYLPYAVIMSIITMLLAIGVRVGFPNCWRFSLALGIFGWIPTSVLAGLYGGVKGRIANEREAAWRAWGQAVERRIREFEGLYGDEREDEIASFMEWVREGEGVSSYSPGDLIERRSDEESAIGPAMTDEEYQESWRGFRRSRGSDVEDPEDGWEMEGTGLRELHMAVHWRQNADEQARAHEEAQQRARADSQLVNTAERATLADEIVRTVAVEASARPQSAAEVTKNAGKVVEQMVAEVDQG